MIILSVLNTIAIFLCMYTLISKKYRTKSKDVTIVFLCMQFLFLCNLWATLDGNFSQPILFMIKNYVSFAMLTFCMYRVKYNIFRIDKLALEDNLIDKIGIRFIAEFKNTIKRIKRLFIPSIRED